MKIVLAPDKFKGSLTGIEFCDAVTEGIHSVFPKAEIIKIPLADGGDGTIDVLNCHLQGERIEVEVNDPLFRPIKASYFYIRSTAIAYLEMAEASGIRLLTPEEQNCMNTTTYGTGEIIQDAVNRGAKTIILGLGGSATNDCGIGMASALGYKFIDRSGKGIIPIGKNLHKIKTIDASKVSKALKKVTFKVACDVANQLYGLKGAAYIYGSQKGASQNEVMLLNRGLYHIANIFSNQFNIDVQNKKGSGAAGGMGAGTLVFLNADLLSGIDLVKELIDFDANIKDADWVITGEGELDDQTLSGKTIYGVIMSAQENNIPVAALCGSVLLQKESLKSLGISYVASILDKAKNIDDAMTNSYAYLSQVAADFAKKYLIPI